MDIARPDQSKAKRKKRLIYGALAVLALVAITVLLAGLKPAAPTLDRNLVYIDTVKRGQMLRQVRGLGTLVPEEIRWIAARTPGRVDKIILRPGATVTPDSVILMLANPDVEQAAANADSQLKAAEAELANLRVTLESAVLQAESVAAGANADYQTSKLRAEVNDQLFKDGLVSSLDRQLSKVTAEQAATRHAIEQKRFAFAQASIAPQLAVKQAEVDRLRAQARLRRDELDALAVRSSMHGVLQLLPVEVGAQVQPGTNLARVADPARLTAELPKGARPDLSVDGTIELERLTEVLYVGRPAFGGEKSDVGIFKLDATGPYAVRTRVKLGRSSVNTIEIVSGLAPGDRVILSDMSQWDANDRIKLN